MMTDIAQRGDPAPNEPRPLAPQTRLGWWALGFMAVAGACMVLNGPLFMWDRSPLYGNNTAAFIYMGVLAVSALVATVLSLIAMTRGHDRAWLLFLPLVPAGLIVLLLIGEFGSALLGFTH